MDILEIENDEANLLFGSYDNLYFKMREWKYVLPELDKCK